MGRVHGMLARIEDYIEARPRAYNPVKGTKASVLDIVAAMRKATGFDFRREAVSRRYIFFGLFCCEYS